MSAPIIDISAHDTLKSESASLTAERHALQNERELVMLPVAKFDLDALASARRADAARSQVTTAEALSHLADDQKTNGIIAGVDALRQQVELQSARQRQIAAENAAAKDKLLLARAIGLPAAQAYDLADHMEDVAVPVPSLDTATAAAMDARAPISRARRPRSRPRRPTAVRPVTGHLPSLRFDGDYGGIGNAASLAVAHARWRRRWTSRFSRAARLAPCVQKADAALHQRG